MIDHFNSPQIPTTFLIVAPSFCPLQNSLVWDILICNSLVWGI